jgi:hypothetical protein
MKEYNVTSAASTNAAVIKASAGNIRRLVVNNTTATARFLKLYNKATAPTVGTDVPVAIITVPAMGQVNLDCKATGLVFGTGIGIALTAAAAYTDVAAVAAGALIVKISYN